MADEINYTYQRISNETISFHGWGKDNVVRKEPRVITVVDNAPPDPIEELSQIKLSIGGQWVGVYSMLHPGVIWDLLSCGMSKPAHLSHRIAALFAQAIWLDTIMHSERLKGHPVVISTCFHDALGHVADGSWDFESPYTDNQLDWNEICDIAFDAGVDFRLQAWLDGVPLEHVLAE